MTLRETIAADATAVFLRTDDFAESITYHPYQYEGDEARAARTIVAIVFREDIQVLSQDGDVVAPLWQVAVANSATDGISSEELDLGGDQLEFPPRDGKTAERRSITRLTIQDHGMLILECR